LDAEFKPLWPIWQLDVLCYGRQRWQDRGKKRQRSGKVGGKNGKVRHGSGRIYVSKPAAARGQGGRVWRGMRLFKVLAARGDAM